MKKCTVETREEAISMITSRGNCPFPSCLCPTEICKYDSYVSVKNRSKDEVNQLCIKFCINPYFDEKEIVS